jgi:diguanylate cyclase (GGDEF)-like protein
MTLADAVLERDGPLDLSGVSNHWLISRTQHRRVINGAVAVWRSADKPEWTEDDSLLIEAVAGQFGVVVAQLATKQHLLERAERDGLTKLYNQRAFLDLLEKRLAKHGSGVLVNIDLDNFKCINDTLGHQTGDKVLKDVAALLEGSLRAGDIASRMGGDEFLLWLDRADTAGAQSVAGRILEGIAHLASGLPVLPRQLGASIGLAKAGNGEMLANLMKRADETMYHAKHGGKGRVSVAG